MSKYFAQVKMANSWILDRVTAKFPCGVRQYTMVEFNDPSVGPVRFTHSKQEFGTFFNSLVAIGGGDCPELAIRGLELALMNSPPKSYILVFTDASASDYWNTTLVNNVYSLINTTKSQIYILANGYCNTTDTPDFAIYRDIAAKSFGHVFLLALSEIYKVFKYLEVTLTMPIDSSTQLFSGDFAVLNHNESFLVSSNFSSFMITTAGPLSSLKISGPSSFSIEKLVSETWGSVLVVKNTTMGNWTLSVSAKGVHSIRVEGFTASSKTSPVNCSQCHDNATCEVSADSVQCVCKAGFIGDGFTCSDIDECAYSWTHNCSASICVNNIGSYTCTCPSGYQPLTATVCVDINECSNSSLHKCHPLATCTNTVGNYSCACNAGYFGNGFSCEVNDCTRGPCGAGLECVKIIGSYLCVDPCSNYTALNESWRSSFNYLSPAYTPLYEYKCDRYLSGWYRFTGSGGLRMPETCTAAYRCGTHAPMWLNGLHPTASDGIVNRTACASWITGCCQWSSMVQVKACPAGYHVYKLSGTPGCNMAYCIDPATSNETCEADEDWKLGEKGYGCYCKSQYKVYSLVDVRPEVTCGTNEMKASFHKCQAKALNFDFKNFKNSSCFQYEDDRYTNMFSVLSRLEAGNCGVTPTQNSTHVTYTSKLVITAESTGLIMRNDSVTLVVSCTYPLDMQMSLSQTLKPILKSTVINVGGTGQFTVTMALFNDSSYRFPFVGSQVPLSVNDMLYIGAYIQGGDNATYALVMKNCYATPSSNVNDTVKYYIIKDSCPNKQDSTIQVTQNGVSREGRVALQMFKFVGDYDSVHLHCALGLCKISSGVCVPVCSGARSAGPDIETKDLTLGPINLKALSSHATISTGAPSILLLPALLLMVSSMFM
ncbi:uromodulin-like [Leptodactylus fuscus]